ncbi:aminoacyl-tRNA hydrolase, partial [Escherichia coli]|nr:aminoacyl-tRNA hydrolase [Escherichia coli]
VRDRLIELIREATIVPKRRRPTKPSKAAKAKRMEGKTKRSTVKSLRGRVTD